MNKFEQAAEIIIYVFNALVILVVIIRMSYWVKMNPPKLYASKFGLAFTWKVFFYLCDVWSNIMFMVYFIISMYWFIMYKLQANAYILMPQRNVSNSTYDIFFTYLVVIVAAKTLAVLLAIIE